MLKIQCPSCSSQFKVGEEFLGKYVECGSCEHQFTVSDTHVTNQPRKTHYPVHKDSDLTGFSKTFDTIEGVTMTKKQEAHLNKLKPDDFMPEPLWKKAVTFLGLGLVIGGVTLLVLGSIKGGFLTDAGYDKRFIIAGFMAFVSSICFFLGAKYAKHAFPKALLTIALFGALAYFLPKYESFTPGSSPNLYTEKVVVEPTAPASDGEYLSISRLKEICRYLPVEEALKRAEANGDLEGKSVVALWIKGAPLAQQYSIQDYFKQTLGVKSRPSYYPRKTGALLILENLKDYTIQDLALLSDTFGPMDDIYISQRLISISYEKSRFLDLDVESNNAMTTITDPQFYPLNLAEARHFDMKRAHSALKRLKNAEPRYTSDALLTYMMILKRYKDPKIINTTSLCMLNWFSDDLTTHLEALDKAADYDKRGLDSEKWPENFVKLLLKSGSTQGALTVMELWKIDPTKWENTLITSGRDFTDLVSKETSSDRIKNLSIINILEKTKSPNSKSLLNSLKSTLDDSYSNAINGAINGL